VTAPLKVAVVGTGSWGEQHARIFAGRRDTALVAVVGRNAERTQRRAEAYGAKGYVSIDEMLDAEKPDLVTTCLPNEGHYEPTLQLIQRGIPLLVEKPLVFELTEGAHLIEEAARQDLFFAINFNHRYAEAVQRAYAAIRRGDLGEIVHASWRFGGEANHGDSAFCNLFETQCHGFDMLEHLVGPISSVMAQMTDKADPGSYNTMAVALEFQNRAVGSLLGTYDSSYAYPDSQYIEINGTAGRLLIQDTVRKLTISKTGDESRQVWEPGYFNDSAREFKHTFDKHVDEILTAFRAGHEPPIHARAGQRAVRLGAACVQSFREGTRILV